MAGVIQVKPIGGFGNQLHMYSCARKYAQLHDCTLETSEWSGRKVFGICDPLIETELPHRNDGGSCRPGNAVKWGETNILLTGYFQFQDWIDHLSRAELKYWFKIDPAWQPFLPQRPKPYTVCHLRRGDYVGHPRYCTVTEASYWQAQLENHLAPLTWVSTDNPTVVPQLEEAGIGFLADFSILMNADVILRANSTFSWWAAVLSDAEVYSPVVEDLTGRQFVPFVKGNHPRCAHPDKVGALVTDLFLSP